MSYYLDDFVQIITRYVMKMENNNNLKLKDILDSSLLIATFTGFIYSLGYVFYLNYYTHFNIPVEMIPDIDFKKILVRGFFVLLNKMPILVGLSGILVLCFVFFSKRLRRRPLFEKLFQFLTAYRHLISIVILISIILYSFPVARDYGLDRARYDTWNLTRVNISFKSDLKNITLPKKLCLLTALEDHFVFFEPVEDTRVKPMVVLIRKQDVPQLILQKYFEKPN